MRICQKCKHDTMDANLTHCTRCKAELRKPMMIYFAHYRKFRNNRNFAYDFCMKLFAYLKKKNIPVYYKVKGDTIFFYRQMDDNDMQNKELVKLAEPWIDTDLFPLWRLRVFLTGYKGLDR